MAVHSRFVRWAVAGVVGLLAAAQAWREVAPIVPHLEVTATGPTRREHYALWEVWVRVRGGEPIAEVRVETVSGPAKVITPPRRDLPPGTNAPFQVTLSDWRTSKAVMRIVQSGRPEPYEIVLQEPQ